MTRTLWLKTIQADRTSAESRAILRELVVQLHRWDDETEQCYRISDVWRRRQEDGIEILAGLAEAVGVNPARDELERISRRLDHLVRPARHSVPSAQRARNMIVLRRLCSAA